MKQLCPSHSPHQVSLPVAEALVERTDQIIEAGVDVVGHAKAATFFQGDETVEAGADDSRSVDSVLALQSVAFKYGKYRLQYRACERLSFVLAELGFMGRPGPLRRARATGRGQNARRSSAPTQWRLPLGTLLGPVAITL